MSPMSNKKDPGFPEPRFNQVRALQIAMTTASTIAIALGIYAFSMAPNVKLVERGRNMSAGERELIAELGSLRASWDPKERQRILDAAPAHSEQYTKAMRTVLEDHSHPLLAQAAEYAGVMGDANLREFLEKITDSKNSLPTATRKHAVLSAELLRPWSQEQLENLLAAHRPLPVKLAALEICAHRTEAPWEQILPFLTADNENPGAQELRDAAIQAIPRRPDAALLQDLWTMITAGDTDAAVQGLRALGRTDRDAKIAEQLTAELDRLEEPAVLAGLELLSGWGPPLANGKPIWTLVQRQDLSPRTHALAFFCLERTRSFDAKTVVEALPTLSPTLQYHAARCLVVHGHPDGPTTLLDLIEGEPTAASIPSRQFLSWMTGMSPRTDRTGFEEALARSRTISRVRPLPEPACRLATKSTEE